jgi:hypothetical protein
MKLTTILIDRIVETGLRDLVAPVESLMRTHALSVHCEKALENLPGVFEIVEASPVCMARPTRHRVEYYSRKLKGVALKYKLS